MQTKKSQEIASIGDLPIPASFALSKDISVGLFLKSSPVTKLSPSVGLTDTFDLAYAVVKLSAK